jgi:integrase
MTITIDSTDAPAVRERREFGHIFRRGDICWIRYRVGGKTYRESTRSANPRKAEKMLARRQAELGLGSFIAPAARRITVRELLDLVTADYQAVGNSSLERAEDAIAHVLAFFDPASRALHVTADRLVAYVAGRRAEGAAPATIKYELSVLRRGFILALKARKITERPPFPTIAVSNTRTGFLEPGDFRGLVAELPEWLRGPVVFAYYSGWRLASEVLQLEWRQVNLTDGTVSIEAGVTKGGEPRLLPFRGLPELETVLKEQRALTDEVERRGGMIIPLVFHHAGGKPIRDVRVSWKRACVRAGVPGLRPHDLRRSAARNLRKLGIPESVIMKLCGWRTRAMFERYNIVDASDVAAAMAKLATLDTTPTSSRVLPFAAGGTRGAR